MSAVAPNEECKHSLPSGRSKVGLVVVDLLQSSTLGLLFAGDLGDDTATKFRHFLGKGVDVKGRGVGVTAKLADLATKLGHLLTSDVLVAEEADTAAGHCQVSDSKAVDDYVPSTARSRMSSSALGAARISES